MFISYNKLPVEIKVNGNAAGAPAAVAPANTTVGRRLPGRFDAMVGDQVIVAASKRPFLHGCRALLELAHDPDQVVVMRPVGSATDCLRGTIGVAAKLTVDDSDRGGIRFRPWKAFCSGAVDAPAALNDPEVAPGPGRGGNRRPDPTGGADGAGDALAGFSGAVMKIVASDAAITTAPSAIAGDPDMTMIAAVDITTADITDAKRLAPTPAIAGDPDMPAFLVRGATIAAVNVATTGATDANGIAPSTIVVPTTTAIAINRSTRTTRSPTCSRCSKARNSMPWSPISGRKA